MRVNIGPHNQKVITMFKRIRTIKGDTLGISIIQPEGFRRMVRAQVTKGSGSPVGRFQSSFPDAGEILLTLSPDTTARMSGAYKYEIAIETAQGVKTVQHGILEVL
jgi:hypothetical protein